MDYEHTQRGLWYLLLFAVAAVCFVVGCLLGRGTAAHYVCLGVALLMVFIGLCFMRLTIRDERDALAVRFGPFPLFFTRVPYETMRHARPDRTKIWDGWGVHYIPGRGTTYNIWGFDCVRVDLENRTIRIGTDDVENLVAFLHGRMQRPRE